MARFSIFRKNLSRVFGPTTVLHRLFSAASPEPPNYCYMMGLHGKIVFPGKRWMEQSAFFNTQPILTQLPPDRLFGIVDPNKPYKIENEIREWFHSGVLLVYICRKIGISLVNPFRKGNVGLVDGRMAFKTLEIDPSNAWLTNQQSGYQQLKKFFLSSIEEFHGQSSLSKIPVEADDYFNDLDNVTNDDRILDHPMHLSDRVFAEVCVEVYRILMKERPATNDTINANNILIEIGNNFRRAFKDCEDHRLMPQWYPLFIKDSIKALPPLPFPVCNSKRLLLSKWEIGALMVEVHRHAFIHSVEALVIRKVYRVFKLKGPNFPVCKTPAFSREEVIQMTRNFFAKYMKVTIEAFDNEKELSLLSLRERNPIPSIYTASPVVVTPGSEVISSVQQEIDGVLYVFTFFKC